MSDETFAALVGAAIGAGVTIVLTAIGRWLTFRDSRAASRRTYVSLAAARLQRFVNASSKEELDAMNDEMFDVSAMSLYLPRWDTAVHLWFAFQQNRLFVDAVAKVQVGKSSNAQIKLFGDVLDVLLELNAWGRGKWGRSGLWFWWQLRTTERYEWATTSKISKAETKKIKADRRTKWREARARLRAEKQSV